MDANPLDDIKNSRSINGVFVNGTWVDANKIKSLLLELEEHNKAERKKERNITNIINEISANKTVPNNV